jgi:hypothetical protein
MSIRTKTKTWHPQLQWYYKILKQFCGYGVQEFPLKSALDPKEFGDPTSAITAQHIESALGGLIIEEV